MKLTVQVADPAGNRTLLVKTPVPREEYGEVARRLLGVKEFRSEQVGFLTRPVCGGAVRLEMMGGEFCGNALRSAGLSYAAEQNFRRERKIPVEISGCDGPLPVKVNLLTGQVEGEMPLPRELRKISLFGKPAWAVVFDGIVHGICETEEALPGEVGPALQALAREFDAGAAGVMFWSFRTGRMTPAVYVKETDSLYFESSCASGSTAVAAWEARDGRNGVHRLDITQPGGTIRTAATVKEGRLTKITVGGLVTLSGEYEIAF